MTNPEQFRNIRNSYEPLFTLPPAPLYFYNMAANEQQAENIKRLYGAVLADIMQNKNLPGHLKDVEGAIEEINKSIAAEQARGGKTEALESVKNDLFYLKYEILERM